MVASEIPTNESDTLLLSREVVDQGPDIGASGILPYSHVLVAPRRNVREYIAVETTVFRPTTDDSRSNPEIWILLEAIVLVMVVIVALLVAEKIIDLRDPIADHGEMCRRDIPSLRLRSQE